MQKLQEAIYDWSLKTFGPQTIAERGNKFREELMEFAEALSTGDHESICDELSDMFVTSSQLVEFCIRFAEDFDIDLKEEVTKKLAILEKRKWKKDENGIQQHVKEGE